MSAQMCTATRSGSLTAITPLVLLMETTVSSSSRGQPLTMQPLHRCAMKSLAINALAMMMLRTIHRVRRATLKSGLIASKDSGSLLQKACKWRSRCARAAARLAGAGHDGAGGFRV